jgi:hypothetical protein
MRKQTTSIQQVYYLVFRDAFSQIGTTNSWLWRHRTEESRRPHFSMLHIRNVTLRVSMRYHA